MTKLSFKSKLKRKWFFLKYKLTSDPLFQTRMSYLDKNLKDKKDLGTLLDVGCGNGYSTALAAAKGWQSLGVNYSQTELDFALWFSQTLKLENAAFLINDIRQLNEAFKEKREFDYILCLEVIEHLLNDRKLIQGLSSFLKKGGKVLLTTPYKYYKPLPGDRISQTEDGNHVRIGYTFADLEKIFQAAGLKVIKKEYFGGLIAQKITALSRILEKRLNGQTSFWLTLPFRLFMPFDRIITDAVGYPYFSVAVIGEKV